MTHLDKAGPRPFDRRKAPSLAIDQSQRLLNPAVVLASSPCSRCRQAPELSKADHCDGRIARVDPRREKRTLHHGESTIAAKRSRRHAHTSKSGKKTQPKIGGRHRLHDPLVSRLSGHRMLAGGHERGCGSDSSLRAIHPSNRLHWWFLRADQFLTGRRFCSLYPR